MKVKKIMTLLCIISILVELIACGNTSQVSTTTKFVTTSQASSTPKVITWKECQAAPIVEPRAEDGSNQTTMNRAFCKWIEDASRGQVKVEILPTGSVVAPKDYFTAVQNGILQMASGFPPYDEGILGSVTNLATGLGGLYNKSEQVYDLFQHYGLADYLRTLYAKHNIYYIPGLWAADYSIITKFKFTSIDDFKGKKIRCGGLDAKFIEKLGAVPVTSLAVGDVYMALQLGTIDGVVNGISLAQDNKWNEVAPYFLSAPCIYVVASLMINMDALNALPAEIRGYIEQYADQAAYDASMLDIGRTNARFQIGTKNGFTLLSLSPADQVKWNNAYWQVISDLKVKAEAKNDKDFLGAYALVEQQLKDWGTIK